MLTEPTDTDGDGYAWPGDCDDTSASVHPHAPEVCDAGNVDEDCRYGADDDDPLVREQTTYYVDADGDGYGTAVTADWCDPPVGYAYVSGDCDDASAAINPGAAEICDPADVDEDCDGTVDEFDPSVSGMSTFYADVDGDGYGSPTTGTLCDLISGWSPDSTDCDDTMGAVNPGATEICDPADMDEDCNGLADDADPGVTGHSAGYADTDGDQYGGATVVVGCDLPDGTPVDPTDCDDSAANIYPGAPESSCTDPVDYNCDGSAGVEDSDGDGYTACRDCNDADPAYDPRAPEANCTDPNDYICDESVSGTDADGDGYTACEECDDAIAGINPGSVERCDGMDNDCDDTVDVGAYDSPTWFADADGDGYTDLSVSVVVCEPPAGYLQGTADDCDDADAAINPGADELVDDGIDQDCDGADTVGPLPVDDTGTPTDTGVKDPGGCGCTSGGGDGADALMLAVAILGG